MEYYFSRNYRGSLKAVIFDWAGTTVDFGCIAPAGVFVDVFNEKGIKISMSEARGPMGLHKRDHIKEIAKLESVSEKWIEVHGKEWDENDIEDMFKAFVPKQMEIITRHSELIPGVLEVQKELRDRKMKIGSTTGYNNQMMSILIEEAKKQGYEPDNVVCATDVPAGRPAPWMAFKNAMELDIYPMESFLKVGDTVSDIEEGLNAGMWSIGVILPSNEMGFTQEELGSKSKSEIIGKREIAAKRFLKAGAHYIIDTLEELPEVMDDINDKLAQGIKP